MVKRMQKAFIQARRDRGGTHFILLVEPMFVLVCLASLPGTPHRAFDAACLVLVWFGFLQWYYFWANEIDLPEIGRSTLPVAS